MAKNENLDPKSVEGSRKLGRQMLMRALCGAYLIYLVYNLLTGLINNPPTGTEYWVVIGACILFTVSSILLFVSCIRYSIKNFKASIDAMDQLDAEEAEEEAEEETWDPYQDQEDE